MYSDLLIWMYQRREESLHKVLVLTGAKQVGKTYIAKRFGKDEYKSYVYINLLKMKSLHVIFQGDISSEEIIKRITANVPNVTLIPGKTLIILDEIQVLSNAKEVLSSLSLEDRYDVLVIGDVEDSKSMVRLMMYPLSFQEFLWSYGMDNKTITGLSRNLEQNISINDSIHKKLENLFREYIVVGGMPEAVEDFSKNKDFSRVDEIQKKIINNYKSYIESNLSPKKSKLILRCYNSISKQLTNELKKFKYSNVEKGETKRKYGSSIDWIIGAYFANKCYNLSNPHFPLEETAKKGQFKLYLNDTGLLSCMYGFETKRAILNDTIKGDIRSGIYENVIAQCLTYNGFHLYYYKPDDNHEVEFIIEKRGEVIPIEVKVGNRITVSLTNFIKDFSPETAYKCVGMKNSLEGNVQLLPYYLIMYIESSEE